MEIFKRKEKLKSHKGNKINHVPLAYLYSFHSINISLAFSSLIASSVLRTSKALGSPEGLFKTGIMEVPGIIPKSSILLLISPLQRKSTIFPCLFNGSLSNVVNVFLAPFSSVCYYILCGFRAIRETLGECIEKFLERLIIYIAIFFACIIIFETLQTQAKYSNFSVKLRMLRYFFYNIKYKGFILQLFFCSYIMNKKRRNCYGKS